MPHVSSLDILQSFASTRYSVSCAVVSDIFSLLATLADNLPQRGLCIEQGVPTFLTNLVFPETTRHIPLLLLAA
jgi:hypothetical protein